MLRPFQNWRGSEEQRHIAVGLLTHSRVTSGLGKRHTRMEWSGRHARPPYARIAKYPNKRPQVHEGRVISLISSSMQAPPPYPPPPLLRSLGWRLEVSMSIAHLFPAAGSFHHIAKRRASPQLPVPRACTGILFFAASFLFLQILAPSWLFRGTLVAVSACRGVGGGRGLVLVTCTDVFPQN